MHTCGHLMTQTSTAAVYHHNHLASSLDSHLVSRMFVIDFIHHLYLSIVIAGTYSTQLIKQIAMLIGLN